MQRTTVQHDHFTFCPILPIVFSVDSLKHGLQVHARILRLEFQSNVLVMSTMMDIYANVEA